MTNTTVVTRPRTVTISFVLWLVTIILGILGSVALLVVAGVESNNTDIVAGQAGVYIAAATITMALALLELVVVFKMRAGRNWARITLLVLAALQVVSAASQGGAGTGFSWSGLVAVIIATVLMFLPASSHFFRKGLSRA